MLAETNQAIGYHQQGGDLLGLFFPIWLACVRSSIGVGGAAIANLLAEAFMGRGMSRRAVFITVTPALIWTPPALILTPPALIWTPPALIWTTPALIWTGPRLNLDALGATAAPDAKNRLSKITALIF